MLLSTEYGKIEIAEGVIGDLVAEIVSATLESTVLSYTASLRDDVYREPYRLVSEGRRKGIAIRQTSEGAIGGLIIDLSLQFRAAVGIGSLLSVLLKNIEEHIKVRLGVNLLEIHVDVSSIASSRRGRAHTS